VRRREAPSAASLKRAAEATMDQFRLSGMYGEIRVGNDGGVLLARVSETGSLDTPGRVSDAEWPRIARSDSSRIFGMAPSLRGVSKSLWFPAEQQRVSVVVAGRTDLLEDTLASFRRFLAELALAGLILAVAGGYWLAVRTLGPIAALTEQVERMAARPPGGGPHRVVLANDEDELGKLGDMFNMLLAKIDSAADHMRTFLADAAHEMKTPVAMVTSICPWPAAWTRLKVMRMMRAFLNRLSLKAPRNWVTNSGRNRRVFNSPILPRSIADPSVSSALEGRARLDHAGRRP